jgi:DNA-binding MarR family transcriptional regulator
MPKRARTRREVTQELLAAGRVMSSAAVMFHTALAEKQRLSATEVKTIDILMRFGPLSAGELAGKCGLAPPSVTGLVDRLEKKGFVRRHPDAADGRKVRIHVRDEQIASFAPLFTEFVSEMERMCAQYTVEEIELFTRFMLDAARRQQACAAKLSGVDPVE